MFSILLFLLLFYFYRKRIIQATQLEKAVIINSRQIFTAMALLIIIIGSNFNSKWSSQLYYENAFLPTYLSGYTQSNSNYVYLFIKSITTNIIIIFLFFGGLYYYLKSKELTINRVFVYFSFILIFLFYNPFSIALFSLINTFDASEINKLIYFLFIFHFLIFINKVDNKLR